MPRYGCSAVSLRSTWPRPFDSRSSPMATGRGSHRQRKEGPGTRAPGPSKPRRCHHAETLLNEEMQGALNRGCPLIALTEKSSTTNATLGHFSQFYVWYKRKRRPPLACRLLVKSTMRSWQNTNNEGPER